MLGNADDKVVSTSGEDDHFEVVPQVFVGSDGFELTEGDLTDEQTDGKIKTI